MSSKALTKSYETLPTLIEDFFRPWNDWWPMRENWTKTLTMPSVNVAEHAANYELTLAAPGMKKNDFKIDLEGNTLTISSEKEDTKEQKEAKYSRKEYSYSSFSRSFTLPEDVLRDKIDAKYDNGILTLMLPKKEEAMKASANKMIEVK